MDGDDLSRQFSEEVAPPLQPATTNSNINGTISQPLPEDQTEKLINEPIPAMNGQIQPEPEIKVNSPKLGKSNSSSGLVAAAAVLIVAVIVGLWYYFTNIEGKEIAKNSSSQTQSTDAQTSTSTASATTASASTPDSVAIPADGVNLQAKFVGKCWTKVIVDGRIAYEGTAEAGQILSWQGKDRIIVTAGNAGAVEFIENGSNLGLAGADGDVIEKTFIRK